MTQLNEYMKTAKTPRILGISQNTPRAWAEAGKISADQGLIPRD